MKGFSKILIVVLIAIFVIGGGYYALITYYFGGTGEDENSFGETEFKTYRNDRYGFEFKYLSDFELYEKLDYEKRELTPVSPMSEIINLANIPIEFFTAGADLRGPEEVVIFSEQTELSASEWLVSHYPDAFKEVEPLETDFDGRNAAIFPGQGSIGSSGRVSVIEMNGYLLIINQLTETDEAGFRISTFRFTK